MKSFDSLIVPAARAAMHDDRRIRTVISRIVPPGALVHVTFCRLAERGLRVTLDSAAWIPKLRYTERVLLAALLREGLDVRTVSWHVTPAKNPGVRTTLKRRAAGASPRAANTVLSAAAELEAQVGTDAGDELVRQMRRMARNMIERDPIERDPTELGPVDHDPADRGPADRGPADRGPADRGPADRGPADRGPVDRGPVDHGPTVVPS